MVNKLKYLELLTADEGKLIKDGSEDIDNSDSVCDTSTSHSTSGSASKSSNCSKHESNTEEFKDD